MKEFYHMELGPNDNLPDYMNRMKNLVDQINAMKIPFKISDVTYAGVLAQSLPENYEAFVDKLFPVNLKSDVISELSVIQFQRDLKDEYYCKTGSNGDDSNAGTQQANVVIKRSSHAKPSLANRISGNNSLFCNCCKKHNHSTDHCHFLGKPLCDNCKCFEHATSKCYHNVNKKHPIEGDTQNNDRDMHYKKGKNKHTSNAAEKKEQLSAVFIEELPTNSYPSEELEEKNKYVQHEENNYGLIEPSDNKENVFYAENGNKLRSLYLMCLADTGTMSHIFSQQEIFTDYRETPDTYVGGVGGNKTHAHGKGTVTLLTRTNGIMRTIQLRDTSHVPDSKQNLISLGR